MVSNWTSDYFHSYQLVTRNRRRSPRPFSTVWERTLRTLLTYEKGWPVDPVTMCFASFNETTMHTLCAFAQTRKKRLVFWPTLATRLGNNEDDPTTRADHVTLDPNGRMHITGYHSDGRAWHRSRGSLIRVPGVPGSLWFTYCCDMVTLQTEPQRMNAWLHTPIVDGERRKSEFVKYAQQSKMQRFDLPLQSHESYVFSVCYLLDDGHTHEMLPSDAIRIPLESSGTAVEKQNIVARAALVQIGTITLFFACTVVKGMCDGTSIGLASPKP